MNTGDNPFEEMERFFERMSRQFEEAAGRWDGDRNPLTGLGAGGQSMALDLVDEGDAYVAAVDLPGYERDEVTVRVTDHTLLIEADHEAAHEETGGNGDRYIRQERRHRSATRSVELPGEVAADEVSARMKHGVLTIRLPKREATEARAVEIAGE
jgi:HSP20 family protein